MFVADQQSASKSNHNITWTPEVVADLIGARKEARRRKRVWEEWAIREYGGVGIAYNNPNVTFSKVDDMFKGKKYILFCFRGRGIYENLVGTNFFKRKFVLW